MAAETQSLFEMTVTTALYYREVMGNTSGHGPGSTNLTERTAAAAVAESPAHSLKLAADAVALEASGGEKKATVTVDENVPSGSEIAGDSKKSRPGRSSAIGVAPQRVGSPTADQDVQSPSKLTITPQLADSTNEQKKDARDDRSSCTVTNWTSAKLDDGSDVTDPLADGTERRVDSGTGGAAGQAPVGHEASDDTTVSSRNEEEDDNQIVDSKTHEETTDSLHLPTSDPRPANGSNAPPSEVEQESSKADESSPDEDSPSQGPCPSFESADDQDSARARLRSPLDGEQAPLDAGEHNSTAEARRRQFPDPPADSTLTVGQKQLNNFVLSTLYNIHSGRTPTLKSYATDEARKCALEMVRALDGDGIASDRTFPFQVNQISKSVRKWHSMIAALAYVDHWISPDRTLSRSRMSKADDIYLHDGHVSAAAVLLAGRYRRTPDAYLERTPHDKTAVCCSQCKTRFVYSNFDEFKGKLARSDLDFFASTEFTTRTVVFCPTCGSGTTLTLTSLIRYELLLQLFFGKADSR